MIPVSRPDIGEEEIRAATRVLKSGRLSDGLEIAKFENNFSRYIGVPHCSAVSNGTFALEAVLKYYKIGKGDEVIVPPLTFFATIEAVMNVGAKPVFADIDLETWNMNKEWYQHVTKKTKAVIPVHIFGNPTDMAEILHHSGYYNLKVIEDCCQAHGSTVNHSNFKVGSLGHAGIWSFYATKNMTTGGEGGAITTSETDLYSFITKYKNHGMVDRDNHDMLGTNGRMSEMEAVIGNVQLSRLDEMNAFRTQQAREIQAKLKHVSWLIPQRVLYGHLSSYFWNAFWVNEEKLGQRTDRIVDYLKNFMGIEVRYRYTKPLFYQSAILRQYPHWLAELGEYPNAHKICGKVIGLPLGPYLTPDNIDYIVDTLKKI